MSDDFRMLELTDVKLFKLVLGGSWAVGKTSIRRRYLGHGFKGEYIRTLGADFALKTTKLTIGGQDIKIQWQIWDLAGQPAFKVIRRVYIGGAKAALVVYDITRPETLEDAMKWCEEIWKYCGQQRRIPIILLGNKIDLRGKLPHDKLVTREEGLRVARSLGIPFFETSAKTGENIDAAFEHLGKTLLQSPEKNGKSDSSRWMATPPRHSDDALKPRFWTI